MYALDRYENISSWKLKLVNKTAMRIGAGHAGLDPTEPDNSVIKQNGKPFIPGSSLKGVFRAHIEALFSEERHHCFVCGKRGFAPNKENRALFLRELDGEGFKLCPHCALFGNEFIQGRVYFSDFLLDRPASIAIRDGVGIDRATETAANQKKYDYEVVEPGAAFSGELLLINLNQAGEEYRALKLMVEWINLGIIRIGGSVSRGLGRFEATLEEEMPLGEAMKRV